MSWFEHSTNETEAGKSRYMPFIAVDFDFLSQHTRVWSGIGTITINGAEYTGVGDLGEINSPPEHTRLVPESKHYALSGVDLIDPSRISESDIDNSFGRAVTEYLGFVDPNTWQMVAEPEINWEGRMGVMRRIEGPEPKVTQSAEHRLAIMNAPDGYRYTHEHAQEFFSGELGFREVPGIETKEVLWGGQRVLPGQQGAINGVTGDSGGAAWDNRRQRH